MFKEMLKELENVKDLMQSVSFVLVHFVPLTKTVSGQKQSRE